MSIYDLLNNEYIVSRLTPSQKRAFSFILENTPKYSTSEELDYLERKRREAEGLENRFTEQRLPTKRFDWSKVPGNLLAGITGGFNLPLRTIATGVSAIKGDMGKLYPGYSFDSPVLERLKASPRIAYDVMLNQGEVQNWSLDTILRKYGGDFWSKPINYTAINDWVSEKTGIPHINMGLTSEGIHELFRKKMENLYQGKDTGISTLDYVINKANELGIPKDKIGKLFASRWSYLLPPIAGLKIGDIAENVSYEMTKDPAALVTLGAEILLDPTTWIGAPGATKSISLGAKTVATSTARGLIDDALRVASKGAGLSDDAARLVSTGLKVAGTKTDDAARIMSAVSKGSKSSIDDAMRIINRLDDAKVLKSKPLTDAAADVLKECGRNALKGNVELTDEGLKFLSRYKDDLARAGFWDTPEMKVKLQKYLAEYYDNAGQLPIGPHGNLAAQAKATSDVIDTFRATVLEETIKPKFLRDVFATGEASKYLHRGGYEFMPFGIRTNKTIMPYSAWESTGMPQFGAIVAEKIPKQIKAVASRFKILFRSARLAPEELHEIFLTQMQFIPAYKTKKFFNEINSMRKEYGLPEIMVDKNETLYTFQIAFEDSVNELLDHVKNNPKALKKLEELAKEQASEAIPYLESIELFSKRMDEYSVPEVRNAIAREVDIVGATDNTIALMNEMKDDVLKLKNRDIGAVRRLTSDITELTRMRSKVLADLTAHSGGLKSFRDTNTARLAGNYNTLINYMESHTDEVIKILDDNIANSTKFSGRLKNELLKYGIGIKSGVRYVNGEREFSLRLIDEGGKLVNLEEQLKKIQSVPESLRNLESLRIKTDLLDPKSRALVTGTMRDIEKNLGLSNLQIKNASFNLIEDPLIQSTAGGYYYSSPSTYTLIQKSPGPDRLIKNTRTFARNQIVTKEMVKYKSKAYLKRVIGHEYAHLLHNHFFSEGFPSEVLANINNPQFAEEIMADALGVKIGSVSYDHALTYLTDYAGSCGEQISKESVKSVFDASIGYVDEVIAAKKLARNPTYTKLVERARSSLDNIDKNYELIRKNIELSYEGSGPWKSYKKTITDLSDMANDDWPEVFRYTDNMTKKQKLRVSKLRQYAQDWVNLPENEMAYARALSDKLKEFQAYENIKGIGTPYKRSMHGDYVPGVTAKERTRGIASTVKPGERAAADIAEAPGFIKKKYWDNPIDYIIANPGLEDSVETRLTKLVYNRGDESIKAAATTDYLRNVRRFGVEDDVLSDANRYYEKNFKSYKNTLDPRDALARAKAETVDIYGFDPTLFTEKLSSGMEGEDIYGILTNYNFTPEVADYLTVTSQFFADKEVNKILQTLQAFNRWWKPFATVIVPGFHARNAQSNLFNMFLADGSSVLDPTLHAHVIKAMDNIDGDFYHPVLQRRVKYTELIDEASKRGVFDEGLIGADIRNIMENRFAQDDFWTKAATRYNPGSSQNVAVEAGMKLGGLVENEARLALFMDNWMKFGDMDHATSVVHKYLFNYRDITVFDSQIMKTLVPFWVWSKKNVPLQWTNLFRQPRKFGLFVKFKDYMRNISEDPRTGEIPGYEWEPEYIKELFGVPTPFMTPSGTRMVYNPNFAFQDIGKITSKDWLSGLTPPVKAPLELFLMKEEIFTGAPIRPAGSSGLKEAPAYLDWLRKTKIPLPGVYEGVGYEGEPITMIDPYLDYAIKQFPLAGNIGRALPQSERLKEKSPLKILSMLGGIKFFEHNPETAEYWYLKDRIEELERMKDFYRKRGLWSEY